MSRCRRYLPWFAAFLFAIPGLSDDSPNAKPAEKPAVKPAETSIELKSSTESPAVTPAAAATGTNAAGNVAPVDYVRQVKPLLEKRCYACHGSLAQKGNLRLDTGELIRKGGENGAAVVGGKSAESLLLERVSAPEPALRMPPEGAALAPAEIELLKRWIDSGATSPVDEKPQPDPREHWSFRKPLKAPLPRRADGSIPAHPVDAFILAQLDAAKLPPRPLADKATLLRRVTLDLIGLPPTRDELHAFLADESPQAYDNVVTRLLSDPRYGERWGRHWMDVWRYADWHGRRYVPDVWNSAPQVWRWRDWIVRSLNQDHGYDRMVREMLAGDEVAGDDPSAVVATAYLIRNWYALNPNDWMRANVEHTSKAFLGLTFNCAHCHDHKYDPISQDDYFRFRALFEPINIRQDRVGGEADPGPFQEYQYGVLRKVQRLGAIQVFDKNPTAPTWFYTGGDERNRVTNRGSMAPGLPTFLGGDQAKFEPVTLPATAWYPALRPEILETLLADQRSIIAALEKELVTARPEVAMALPALKEKQVAAEAKLALAKQDATTNGKAGALAGQQSLLLNATTGRRTLQNGLTSLKSLEAGTTISFQLRILQDAHINFQLAKDVVQGLTASFVAFEKGRILAYQPGGFNEFQAGVYDFGNGQNLFEVSLTLEPATDRCLLTVVSLPDKKLVVDQTPVALNGWNPIGDPKKAISFDARTGVIAAIDEFKINAPDSPTGERTTQVLFNFEAPAFTDQLDVNGIEGWILSQFSVEGATSLVTSILDNSALTVAVQELNAARRAVAAQELRIQSIDARITAAKAEIASLEARAMADRAKYAQPVAADLENLSRTANECYRDAITKKAEADILTHDQKLAVAETKPITDANRAKEIEAASKLLGSAREALKQATVTLTDPSKPMTYPNIGTTYPPTSTGRRKALATWITGRDNPLAARVAVNHIWLRHFQNPLVATVFDFGRNGAQPTHPELLDWLAVEFMESGWSFKHLHRLLVTSEAYRRVSSTGDPSVYAADSDNRLLWRMNTGRMESEVVRDSILLLAGKLDPTMGGQELENSDALKTFRRTLYYSCQPEIDGKNEFGALFDAPEPADCYRRTRSIIPQQSLALTNSQLIHDSSSQLLTIIGAKLTPEQQADPATFITASFESILTRKPTPVELAACLEFLTAKPQTGDPAVGTAAVVPPADPVRLREGLLRALLNHNDFISIR